MYCVIHMQIKMKIHKFALATIIAALCCGASVRHGFAANSPAATASPSQVAPAGTTDLNALIAAGTLPDLRWPNFTDYRDSVKKFYDAGGDSLAWIQNGNASPQAVSMILQFQQAALKGLNPEDYDASRWDARLARAPTNGVAEAYRRRSCAYRFGADGFRDALHFRSAYWKGQPAALQVRPDGRSQKV